MIRPKTRQSKTQTATIETLLRRIAALQSTGDGFYDAGLFPCRRYHSYFRLEREDNNIFCTALIVFILQSFQEQLPAHLQELCQQIITKAKANYPKYRNKYGLKTYNFWQTFPPNYFPKGIFSYFSHFELPDDLDDTAMIYLSSRPERQELLWLKEKMGRHANLSKKRIRNTFAEYRDLKAYSVWFGKNMPLEFDICVLCNILEMVFHYRLPLSVHDQDSLKLLRHAIEHKKYLSEAFYLSPNYPTPSLILYHLGRLLGNHPGTGLEDLIPALQKDIETVLETTSCPLEKTLLSSSLLRLGAEAPLIVCPLTHPRLKKFWYFRASLLKPLDNYALGKPSRLGISHLKWKCEALNLTFLLEQQLLLRSRANDGL